MTTQLPICSACGEPDSGNQERLLSSSRGRDKMWKQCHHCHSYFCAEPFAVEQEIIRGTSTSYGAKDTGLKNAAKNQHLYRNIVKLVKRNRQNDHNHWLDLGCSFGGLMEKAKAEGFEVTGLDILPQAVEHIRSSGMQATLASTVAQVPLDKRFDIISAIDSNYYWPDQPTELAEIFRRLSEKGLFVLRSTDKSWLVRLGLTVRRLLPSLGRRMIAKGLNDHRFSMPMRSMLALARRTGFKLVTVDIAGAYYSDASPAHVRGYFLFSGLIHKLFRYYVAPGYIVVFRK